MHQPEAAETPHGSQPPNTQGDTQEEPEPHESGTERDTQESEERQETPLLEELRCRSERDET